MGKASLLRIYYNQHGCCDSCLKRTCFRFIGLRVWRSSLRTGHAGRRWKAVFTWGKNGLMWSTADRHVRRTSLQNVYVNIFAARLRPHPTLTQSVFDRASPDAEVALPEVKFTKSMLDRTRPDFVHGEAQIFSRSPRDGLHLHPQDLSRHPGSAEFQPPSVLEASQGQPA